MMKITKTPGFSLLLVGAILFFLVRPVIDSVPVVGGAFAAMAFVVGLLGLVGGGYLVARALTGAGRS